MILLVSQWCATCPDAERLWNKLKSEYNFDFQVLDVSQPDGRALAKKLMIRAVPSTVIDGKLAFVGVPEEAEARKVLES
ncbi:MAG: thioredoxin family protein [Aquificaceae bacterium]|nr:thioredoxin family protein [Aquificaceae bacterium]